MLHFPDLDEESKGISWIQSNPFDMQCTPAMMEQATAEPPTPLPDLEYSLVTDSRHCNRVTTVEECKNAAQLLGLADTTASPTTDTTRPPYCYYKTAGRHMGLKFNKERDSTTACSELRQCICHTDGECRQVTDYRVSMGAVIILYINLQIFKSR